MKMLLYIAAFGAIAAFATGRLGLGLWAVALAILAFLIYHDDQKRRVLGGSDDPETRAFWERIASKYKRDR